MFAYTKLMQAMAAAGVVSATDPYFNLVTLLLPGNGTNGAQNNTFLDSSTNNFTITRNGNTTQGTFTPFSQTGWGNYFATGSLQAGSNAALAPGSGNFTIECWVYPVGNTTYMGIYQNYTDGLSRSTALRISINATDNTSLIVQTQASAIITTATGAMTANAWNHIALVRNGSGSNNLVLYVNGVSKGTATNTTNFSDGYAQVGNTVYNAANYYWNGYISNFRLTTGAALYTGSFTPSTVPLTTSVSSGTVALLTCQSNRFVDNSSNGFSFTISGTPSVQAFSPFTPTAAYSAATNGGSGYFDGSGDYLSSAANTAFTFGSGAFTVEGWIYPTGVAATYQYIASVWGISGQSDATYSSWVLRLNTSNLQVVLQDNASGALVTISQSSGAVRANAWSHVAVVRNSNTVTLYLNGVSVGSGTFSATLNNPSSAFVAGLQLSNNNQFAGYISSLRIVKGTAVYTTAFTPPTAPFTDITNTSLLLNFTNGGIIDATGKNVLETVGNAQISTTQSKFGGSSMYFDGTGDWLSIPASGSALLPKGQDLNLGSGNFTIEFWMYSNNFSAARVIVSCGYEGTTQRSYLVYVDSSSSLHFGYSTTGSNNTDTTLGSTGITTGSWIHVAVVRNGSTVTGYVNGTALSTTVNISTNTLYSTAGEFTIGSDKSNSFNGYIDDLRISKYARYTANFTAPTAAFPLS
jgi:hypothetical protein